jgi:hypothetical protein
MLSKSGGGLISTNLSLESENAATASGPYGIPNLSSASLLVMSFIWSAVSSPPFGARNSERIRVCVRGEEMVSREIVEGEDTGSPPEPEGELPRKGRKGFELEWEWEVPGRVRVLLV